MPAHAYAVEDHPLGDTGHCGGQPRPGRVPDPMTWFRIDDSMHSHPKTSAASLAAIGLWTVAGSWCGAHLTDGQVPEHVVGLLSRGAVELADELVACGLWKRTRGGFRFHQWDERNPSRVDVESLRARRAEAGRLGGLASGKVRSTGEANGRARASPLLRTLSNPRPDPPPTGGRGVGGRPAQCKVHRGQPAHNCGACRAEELSPP